MTTARHLHLTAAELEPGDQLADEPAFTVATVELEPAPAVVAKLTSTAGIVRWVGQAAQLPVRRAELGLDPRAAFEAGGDNAGERLSA